MQTLRQLYKDIPYKYLLLGPAVLFSAGALLNQLVCLHNGGLMPVLIAQCNPRELDDGIHSCMTAATHWKILCDWLTLERGSISSPGDWLIYLGDAIWYPGLAAWFALIMKRLYEPISY